jgi:hypothetical protein
VFVTIRSDYRDHAVFPLRTVSSVQCPVCARGKSEARRRRGEWVKGVRHMGIPLRIMIGSRLGGQVAEKGRFSLLVRWQVKRMQSHYAKSKHKTCIVL